MLPRSHRLSSPLVFKVLRRGILRKSSDLSLRYLKNQDKNLRFGIIVGSKLHKPAKRNRLKRLLRESLRHLIPQMRSGYDIVFITSSGLLEKTQMEVEQSLRLILAETNLLQ